jgi:hypothetical protein
MVKEEGKPTNEMWPEFPPWEHVEYKDQIEEYFKIVKRLSNMGLNPKTNIPSCLSQKLTLLKNLALVLRL